MSIFLLFLLFVSFIWIIKIEYNLKSVTLVLWGGLFVFFFVPHSIDIFIGPPEYNIEIYNKASLFAFSFNLIYLTTRLFLKNSKNLILINSKIIYSDNFNNSFIRFQFLLLIISFLFLLYYVVTTFGSFFNFSWIDVFDNRSSFSYFMFSYLFGICMPLPFITYFYKKKKLFIVTILILITIIFLFRIRTFLIPITIPFIVSFLISDKFKINLVNIFKVFILSILIIFLIVAVGVLKSYNSLTDFFSSFNPTDFFEMIYFILFSKYGELGLRNAFYFYLQNNNDFTNFGLGLGYIRLLLLPIPTFMSFGIKPQDFAMDMAMAYDPINSTPGVNSMHPTLYGDCFANLGWYGILLGIFWAFFAYIGDRLTISKTKNVLFICMFVAYSYTYTLIARGAVYNAVYNIFFILLTNSLLVAYLKFNSKLKSNKI